MLSLTTSIFSSSVLVLACAHFCHQDLDARIGSASGTATIRLTHNHVQQLLRKTIFGKRIQVHNSGSGAGCGGPELEALCRCCALRCDAMRCRALRCLTVMMTAVKAVDDWSFVRRIRSRGEAIRQLVTLGLKASGAPVGSGQLGELGELFGSPEHRKNYFSPGCITSER